MYTTNSFPPTRVFSIRLRWWTCTRAMMECARRRLVAASSRTSPEEARRQATRDSWPQRTRRSTLVCEWFGSKTIVFKSEGSDSQALLWLGYRTETRPVDVCSENHRRSDDSDQVSCIRAACATERCTRIDTVLPARFGRDCTDCRAARLLCVATTRTSRLVWKKT